MPIRVEIYGAAGVAIGVVARAGRLREILESDLDVLGPQGTALLLSGFTKTNHYLPGVVYGYGVQAVSIDGHPSLGHSGRLLGFRSVVRHFPLEGLTIAVLTNQSRADPGVIVRALLAEALPAPAPATPNRPMPD